MGILNLLRIVPNNFVFLLYSNIPGQVFLSSLISEELKVLMVIKRKSVSYIPTNLVGLLDGEIFLAVARLC